MLAEVVKPEYTLPGTSIYVSRRSQTGRYYPSGFHICQQKKSTRKIISQWLPYMLAEEVKPEDILPIASIYVSRRSQTGRYSQRGFHIRQEKQSNRMILSHGLPYMLGEVVKAEDTLPGASAEEVKPDDTRPAASIYSRSQTGRYSPMGFHICYQKKSNRQILSLGLPYMLAEEVKPEDTIQGASLQTKSTRKILSQRLPYIAEEVKPEDPLPGASIYGSRRSQTGRYSPRGFHICQQKKSNRKILSQRLPYIAKVKPEDTLRWASIYVTRRSQTGRYSLWGFHICQQKNSNRKIPFKGLPYRRSQTERYSPSGYHIQQKKSNRKILSQGLPYMVAEEVKPEDTLPGASIYVSRRSQTGSSSPRGFHICQEKQSSQKILSLGSSIYVSRSSQTGIYSPRDFHICQQKKSNRKILSQRLPYMLAEEVNPEDNLPVASIYVSRRSQTRRYSPNCFHICQQKKSNRKILAQGLPYMLAEEVKPEVSLPGASIYVRRSSQSGRYSPRGFSRSSQTGRYSPTGFHICQQKKSNRIILSQWLQYMLAEEVNPEDTLPAASIYVSRRSQTERYSPRGFHICQQKKSNRKILAQGASIYVSRRSQTGRYSSSGFHICQQKQSNRTILSHGLPYMLGEVVKGEDTLPGASAEVVNQEDTLPGASIYVSRRSQPGRYSPSGFHICQQKKSNRKILAQGLPYMLAEEVKPEDNLPWASIYVSRRSQTGRFSPKAFHICQQKKSNRKILFRGFPYRRSQTGRDSPRVFHICQQKKSNRKILSQWLPYMLAEEVKPEDTRPGASIYVSRRSQTGRYSPHGLPYMLAEEVKPDNTLPVATIYVSRRSQTGRYSSSSFHICQQKKSNRKILSQGLPYMLAEEVKPEDTLPAASQKKSNRKMGFHICQQKKSNRKILSQGLPYMLAEEVKPEDTLPGVSIQKKSNRKRLSQGLPYMLAEEVKPENTLPVASIYVSRRSQTGRYSPRGFHICQQKKSNRKILSHGLPYMLAEEVKPEDSLPRASIYVSRRSQTGRYSPMGFHICQQKK